MDGSDQRPPVERRGLERVSQRASSRRRRGAVLGGLAAMVCLAAAVNAFAAAGDGSPVDAGGATYADSTTRVEDDEVTTSASTTTTSIAANGDARSPETSTTAAEVLEGDEPVPPDPEPLGLIVSPAVLAPYAELTVRSADPCPAGSNQVEVFARGVGGTTDGIVIGGGPADLAPGGHWSSVFGIVAVGPIENVAWANVAPEVEVRATCSSVLGSRDPGGPRVTALTDYVPARIRNAAVAVVPELRARWDGYTATIEYSGCPNAYLAYLDVGDAPPPSGPMWGPPEAHGRASPGTTPDTWIATIDLPGYDRSDGLWATASCQDSSGVSAVWRYQAVELDPPG